MVKNIELIPSKDEEANNEVDQLLAQFEGKITIKKETEFQNLMEEFPGLPIIYTDEGDNYYGLERVKDFVERQKITLARQEVESA